MYTYRFAGSSSVHLTICVLKLDSDAKVKKAAEVLDRVLKMMKEADILGEEGLQINIDGVGTFPDLPLSDCNPKMFLLQLTEDEKLERLKWIANAAIRECVKEGLIDLSEDLNYRFHMSLVDSNFSPEQGQYLGAHKSRVYEGTAEPQDQLTKLDSLGSKSKFENATVCIHSHPHITYLTGVRPPRDYETFEDKNYRDFGGRKATS